MSESLSVVSNSLGPMDSSLPGSSIHPWDFPGKSTGVRGTYISESVKYHASVECPWFNSRMEEGKAALEELLRHKKSKVEEPASRRLPELCCLVIVSNSFVTPSTVAAGLLCPWDFPGENTGVGCPSLFQGIFPTQIELVSPVSLRWQVASLPLRHQGSPK